MNLSDDDICIQYGKILGSCEMIFYRECVISGAGYKMLIDIPEWIAPSSMFSEKLSISRNESAEILNAKVYHLRISWTMVH